MKGIIEPIMAAKLTLGKPKIIISFVDDKTLRVKLKVGEETKHVDIDVVEVLYNPGSKAQFSDCLRMMVNDIKFRKGR